MLAKIWESVANR